MWYVVVLRSTKYCLHPFVSCGGSLYQEMCNQNIRHTHTQFFASCWLANESQVATQRPHLHPPLWCENRCEWAHHKFFLTQNFCVICRYCDFLRSLSLSLSLLIMIRSRKLESVVVACADESHAYRGAWWQLPIPLLLWSGLCSGCWKIQNKSRFNFLK